MMFRSISLIPRKAVHDFFAVRDFSGFSKFLAVKKEKAKKALPSIPLMSLKKEALTLWSMKTKSQRKDKSFSNFYDRFKRIAMNKAPGINVKAVRADARLEWDSMPDVKKQKYGFVIKKATKVKKAPSNRPKKPLSSFFLYVTETREAVQAANPDLKLVQVTTLIGQKWAALPIDQKQVYMDKAKRALESYNLANPKVESVKVKRPVTGFIRFASEKRPELLSKSPDLKSNVAAQSKIFSAMWKALDESTKAKYVLKKTVA